MTDTQDAPRLLETIRAAAHARGHTPTTLAKAARIDYRSAWTLLRGDSLRIAWRTLDSVLQALGLALVTGRSSDS